MPQKIWKACVHNLGCKVNSYEAQAMEQLLEKAGVPEKSRTLILAERKTRISELVTAVSDAETAIEKAEKRLAELKKAYEAALARINKVEEISTGE